MPRIRLMNIQVRRIRIPSLGYCAPRRDFRGLISRLMQNGNMHAGRAMVKIFGEMALNILILLRNSIHLFLGDISSISQIVPP